MLKKVVRKNRISGYKRELILYNLSLLGELGNLVLSHNRHGKIIILKPKSELI